VKVWEFEYIFKGWNFKKKLLTVDTLIQEKRFSDAMQELNDILSSNLFSSSKFNELLSQAQEKLNFCKKKKLEQEKEEKEKLEKIKKMMSVSTRINLDRMQNVLDMDKKTFDNKIFEWAEEFGFTIDGDNLIINVNTVSDFIEALDKQFASWEKGKEKM